jgi:hypothetical protein
MNLKERKRRLLTKPPLRISFGREKKEENYLCLATTVPVRFGTVKRARRHPAKHPHDPQGYPSLSDRPPPVTSTFGQIGHKHNGGCAAVNNKLPGPTGRSQATARSCVACAEHPSKRLAKERMKILAFVSEPHVYGVFQRAHHWQLPQKLRDYPLWWWKFSF